MTANKIDPKGDSPKDPEQGRPPTFIRVLTIVAWLLIVIVAVGYFIYWFEFPKLIGLPADPAKASEHFGQFGDAFGAFNALVSSLTLCVIVITLILQLRQNHEQELQLKQSTQTQREIANASAATAQIQDKSLRIEALTSMINATASIVSAGDEKERKFHLLELKALHVELQSIVSTLQMQSGVVQDRQISEDDVIELLPLRFGYMNKADIQNSASLLVKWFRGQGVTTRWRLERVLDSQNSVHFVEQLYIEELFRHPQHPLDPSAVAVWASFLFRVGVTSKNINALRNDIRNSEERKAKERTRKKQFLFSGLSPFNAVAPALVVWSRNGQMEIVEQAHYNHAVAFARDEIRSKLPIEQRKIFVYDFDADNGAGEWVELPIPN